MESRKKPKSNKGRDMISDLPDFIIGRILSFLPTKDAVATSVLSKSWIYRWTFLTDLQFEDRKPYSNKKIRKFVFLSFVNGVLLHLNSSSIQSFSLYMSDKYKSFHVDQWISAVVSRRVKKLCIKLKKEQQILSSHSIMKYKSLEELVLDVYDCDIKVPTFALFSSLAVLNLSGIKFIGGPSNISGKVDLHFPVLRSYKTKNCTWSSSLKCVTLEAPLLEVVSIKDFRRRSPSADNSYPVIKFCASHLTEFTYSGYLLPDTMVFDLSAAHIASANITIDPYKLEEQSVQETVALTSKLLKQFKNVESLKFKRSMKVSVLLLQKDSLVNIRAFEMLSHLELGSVTGEALLTVLLKTPCLKTLVILQLLRGGEEQMNYDRVPECFLNTLQVVKFMSFDGSEHQLSFAKFVMENALVLKRMSFILTSWNLHGSKLEEVKEKLYSFKKCAGFAILEFSAR